MGGVGTYRRYGTISILCMYVHRRRRADTVSPDAMTIVPSHYQPNNWHDSDQAGLTLAWPQACWPGAQ